MRLSPRAACLIALAALSAFASPGHAQLVPGKPLRIVVGFPPGGGIDVVARLIAPRLSESLARPVVVDNRPGANGLLASELAAKSNPDGHTLLIGTMGAVSLNPLFYAKLPYNAERDFAPLTQVASVHLMVIANPSAPFRTIPELLAYARANPGKANFGSAGNGSTTHLAAELLNRTTGVRTTHVPYKGTAPMMADLMGGQLQYAVDAVAISTAQISAGRLRAIAVTGPKRIAVLPDVPAVAEFVPGYEVVNWYGMVVPSGTPRATVAFLHAEIVKAMAVPDVRERMNAMATEPVGSTPADFGRFLASEAARWGRVIREAGIRME